MKTTLGLLDLSLRGKVSKLSLFRKVYRHNPVLRLLKEHSRLYHWNKDATVGHHVSVFPAHDIAGLELPSRTIIVGMAECKGATSNFVSCSD